MNRTEVVQWLQDLNDLQDLEWPVFVRRKNLETIRLSYRQSEQLSALTSKIVCEVE